MPSFLGLGSSFAASVWRVSCGAVVGAVAVAGLCVAARDTHEVARVERAAKAPPHPVLTVSPPAPAPTPSAAPALGEPAPAGRTWLVATVAGTAYLQLAALGDEPLPEHLAAHTSDTDGVRAWVAEFAVGAGRPQWRALLGQRVVTDRGCTAQITGLAAVARLTGSADYAGLDRDFTADDLRDHGARMIAAKLDGCADAAYAWDASAPARAAVPERAPGLAAAARRQLLASPAARLAQQRWAEGGGVGAWREHAIWDVRVLRHSVTGERWVLAHAGTRLDDCGTPASDLLGSFRVDERGRLAPVSIERLDESVTIDAVIDGDGDGRLELLATPWPGTDRVLLDDRGRERARLDLAFFGCPC